MMIVNKIVRLLHIDLSIERKYVGIRCETTLWINGVEMVLDIMYSVNGLPTDRW